MKSIQLTAKEMLAIGFPQSEMLMRTKTIITKGTIDCSLYAIRYSVVLNVAGGTHHAFAGHGKRFCLLNDFAFNYGQEK